MWRRASLQVEVVGWLIKHEHVRLCVRDGRQRHAGALAAGQGGARHVLLPLGHAARRQVRPQRLRPKAGGQVRAQRKRPQSFTAGLGARRAPCAHPGLSRLRRGARVAAWFGHGLIPFDGARVSTAWVRPWPRVLRVACSLLLVRERAVSREAVHHELEGRKGQVELVGVMLVDEADARAGVAEDLAGGWLQLAQQKLDESRLAVAILAEQHDPGANGACVCWEWGVLEARRRASGGSNCARNVSLSFVCRQLGTGAPAL